MSKNNIIIILIVLAILVGAFLYWQSANKENENILTGETTEEIAENWIEENSPTYLYDGEDLSYIDTRGLDLYGCENCYEVEFTFNSRQAGYGNREGEMSAQVITPHNIIILVEDKEVTKVITDQTFDEMKGVFLEDMAE